MQRPFCHRPERTPDNRYRPRQSHRASRRNERLLARRHQFCPNGQPTIHLLDGYARQTENIENKIKSTLTL